MRIKVAFRRHTAAMWTSNNPTLLSGELGVETDTQKAKLGDGTTAWNSLNYIDFGDSKWEYSGETSIVPKESKTTPIASVSGLTIELGNKLEDITGESIGDLSDVDDTGKANLKTLKYNSTSTNWEVGDDNNTTYTAGDNIDITSEEISLVDKPTIDATSPTAKTYTPATGAQTVTIDCALHNQHAVTGHADGTAITFAISNATNNQPFIISITQGAVVSTITAWFATIKWAGGVAPTLTATVDKRDVFGFIRTGADTYDGFIIGQNL